MEYFDHTERIRFPEPERANPWGIVAHGGNLSPGIVLSAYEQGIFPWYEEPPIVWFSPDPRFVLYLSRFHIGSRFQRTLRTADVTITLDHAFEQVIHRCRTIRLETDGEGTWITDAMERAYTELHRLGFTHSVEVWEKGALVGGLYGVAVGSIFAGESMFSEVSNGSKFALVALAGLMESLGVPLIDCQSYTENLAQFGAVDIPRTDFLAALEEHRHGAR
ncbi:MAG: leucyl/phenylalanyl-tRNA--protein transferase, partial [Alkalispirochaeta sp.]